MGVNPVEKKEQEAPPLTFMCYSMGGRYINQASCQNFCSGPFNNLNRCRDEFQCASPWRFCWRCLEQGLGLGSGLVVDPERGVCEIHLKEGLNVRPQVERPVQTEVRWHQKKPSHNPERSPLSVIATGKQMVAQAMRPKAALSSAPPKVSGVVRKVEPPVVPRSTTPVVVSPKEKKLMKKVLEAPSNHHKRGRKFTREGLLASLAEAASSFEIAQRITAERTGGKSADQIAKEYGTDSIMVYKYLRLTQGLPDEVQELLKFSVTRGVQPLSLSSAVQIALLKGHPDEQRSIARSCIDKRWSVERVRTEVQAKLRTLPPSPKIKKVREAVVRPFKPRPKRPQERAFREERKILLRLFGTVPEWMETLRKVSEEEWPFLIEKFLSVGERRRILEVSEKLRIQFSEIELRLRQSIP